MATTPSPLPLATSPLAGRSAPLVLVLLMVALLVVGLLDPFGARSLTWLATMGLLLAFALIAGKGTTGLWRGVLLDNRNKFSLTRLQTLLWTVLILSAAYTATMANISRHQPNPLSVKIPQEVWMLMGIGITSLVATPLIRGNKEVQPPNPQEMSYAFGVLSARRGPEASSLLGNVGQVLVNVHPQGARWSDLFAGEEVGNATQIDLGKVQMFYVTAILFLTYAAALADLFNGPSPQIDAFPAPDSGLVAILGISNAGYLATMAVPQSRPASAP